MQQLKSEDKIELGKKNVSKPVISKGAFGNYAFNKNVMPGATVMPSTIIDESEYDKSVAGDDIQKEGEMQMDLVSTSSQSIMMSTANGPQNTAGTKKTGNAVQET